MPEQSPESEDFHPDDRDLAVKERAERLRVAVKGAGGNAQVAIRAQINLGTLNNYIAGRDMKASAMIALAKACGVSLDWLATGEGPEKPNEIPTVTPTDSFEDQDLVPVRYYSVHASAGFGTLCDVDAPKDVILIPRSVLGSAFGVHGNNILSMHATGDSMTPTIISGDGLFIDTTPSDNLFGIFVLNVYGAVLVKRLSVRAGGTLLITSDNPIYPPEEVPLASVRWGQADEDHPTSIIGRVIVRFHGMS
ncbi:XRE family transcriptional regulator [Komagataeibacter medellinensis]|uniref:XRE family transcriptional regulator n=1 Tax=Komagataeibacter medellinensis TaxID=1177712 RepID=A0ABQ6VUT5_9PROT|nr:XRE family transcriptional regulator [Komagataeibacter medellinensis]KAB8123967.1 XRE family transcriptional regulator [Komagataeibacter medellinensis]